MTIPTEYEFEINCIGETTGQELKGKFKYVLPTIGISQKIRQETINLDRKVATQGEPLDQDVADCHELIATLKYCMVEAPNWFVDSYYGYNLQDELPLQLISEELKKFREIREKALND